MLSLILSAVGFTLWALSIIMIYYSKSYSPIDHIESATGFSGYLITVFLLYIGYKTISIAFGWKKLKFNFWTISGITLLHILILSIIYTGLPEVRQSPLLAGASISSLTLFIHICTLLLYPILLIVLTRGVGYSMNTLIMSDWRDIDIRLRVPAEITIGFIVFVVGLLVIGSLGYFTLSGLIGVLVAMAAIGYSGHRETYRDILHRSVEIENHDLSGDITKALNLKLLSIEFGFFFLTFLFGISLINVIRPMPIGWDDLGVYMNFPKIMATTGMLLEGSGMYAWQLITGTGFLFGFNASQAFYINQLGGLLAVIAIISTLSYAFEQVGKKSLLSLPILFAAVYYAMPMTVFQQAKDMKLDPAYLFFAISGIMLLFHAWKAGKEGKKRDYLLLGIIAAIVGFTFAVKFTSVMLILACLGVIAYRYLSFGGYIGFFFIFLAFFTKGNLWNIMNVPMPKDPAILTSISIVLGLVGIACIGISLWQRNKENTHSVKDVFSSWIISSVIFGLGVIVGCGPWLVKNIGEIGPGNIRSVAFTSVLSGSGGSTLYPYESLFTKEELAIKKAGLSEGMTKNGKSENEDMGRYFGYESGLNNYLKLPLNLTVQKNQGGEFTDITFIFLALLPGLLLFIRGRRPYTMLAWIGAGLLCLSFYYFDLFHTGIRSNLEAFFGRFTLIIEPTNWISYGYGFLLLVNLVILGFFHFMTADTQENKKLREVMMFMGIYAFLFMIAAFGIVWYGIIVYFGFFLIMGYSASRFLGQSDEDSEEEKSLNITIASIVFISIAIYFVHSAFPHGWNNLRSAYYNEYKYNTLTQEESIFAYRSDYLVPLATMNLRDTTKIFDGLAGKMQSPQMKEFFSKTDLKNLPLDSLHAFIMKYRDSKDIPLRNDVRTLGQHLYASVLYPPKDNLNMGGIYRIGTFMTYLINENRKRYFDDSLVMVFGDYFYDPSPEKTIERMRSLGLKYLLVDLNAATIDRDPRHALTDRAEKLLLTMNASNLKLINTDNFCLELAISERKKGKLTTNDAFIDIAGTNSESYRSGVTLYRNQKLANCQGYIVKIMNEKRAAEYPIIETIQNEIIASNATQDSKKLQAILGKYVGQSWFVLFEILDAPGVSPPAINPTTVSGVTTNPSSSTSSGMVKISTGMVK